MAETGLHDDGFYISMARDLAQTGHLHWNGWGAPTLGLQLLAGALFIKLFGFSFTVVRLTTMLLSVVLTALFQRTLVRAGVTEFNAAVGTLTLMTSPVMLPVAATYLTDGWCMFALVLCLYCCLRSLQETSERGSASWIAVAALGNALFGSARQIAWVGVLVMVPSTIYLERTRRLPRNVGIGCVLVSAGSIAAFLHWLAGQPYTIAESQILRNFRPAALKPHLFVRPALEIPMLCLPVLLPFLPEFRRLGRRAQWMLLAATLLLVLGVGQALREHTLEKWAVPFIVQYGSLLSPKGVFYMWPAWGERSSLLPLWLRAVFSLVTVACTIAFFARLVDGSPERQRRTVKRHLAGLLVPFSIVYATLLLPRALRDLTIDRYVLPLVAVSILVALLVFQGTLQRNLPPWSMAVAAAVAMYSVLTLQDAFGMYRAVVRAGDTLASAGVPRTAFDGGWEYDGWSQLEAGGYMHQTGIKMPPGKQFVYGRRQTGRCEVPLDLWMPDVNPEYALSYSATGCGGPTNFPVISYKRWLWPHTINLYIVKYLDESGKQRLILSH